MPIPFPNSAATVQERRAEAALTYGRPLTANLTLQISLAAEYSQLTQDGAGGISRTFYRPKGFVNLAWRPQPGFDISARLERVVGQLNFFDFVASANVSGGTTNAGNANLVPPQQWNAQLQATRSLGRWGTITARLYGRLISDIVDVVPIAGGGQSPGNLEGTARVYGLQWTSTFNFDPLGLPGAKLDANITLQRSRLTDPLTGLRRAINENLTRRGEPPVPSRHPAQPMGLGSELQPVPAGRGLPARSALPLSGHPGQPRRLRRAQGRARADGAGERRQSARHERELHAAPSSTASGRARSCSRKRGTASTARSSR